MDHLEDPVVNRMLLIIGMLLATASTLAQQTGSTGAPSVQNLPAANPQTTLIAGRVLRANGKPAGNAQVLLSWTTGDGATGLRQVMADDKGVFQVSINFIGKPRGDAILITAVLPGQGIVTHQTSPMDLSLGKAVRVGKP